MDRVYTIDEIRNIVAPWETVESGTKELKEFRQRELNNDVCFDIQLQEF